MITTRIIADSINPAGNRITTALWTYPRFIHSEIMTHRMFARNAASSRAIPVDKMIRAVLDNPAMFEQYGAANTGMSAQEEMAPGVREDFIEDWLLTAGHVGGFAKRWKPWAAKQIVNRALEPWMHMTIIVTATDWNNFFALRAHPDAQPEFQVLAYRFLDRYLKSTPVPVEYGQWHLPFVDKGDQVFFQNYPDDLKAMSVARCARVSYTKQDEQKGHNEDLVLHDRLLSSGHMSPFEHQAMAYGNAGRYEGCYKGWKPYRKFLQNENRTEVDLTAIFTNKPDWITLEQE